MPDRQPSSSQPVQTLTEPPRLSKKATSTVTITTPQPLAGDPFKEELLLSMRESTDAVSSLALIRSYQREADAAARKLAAAEDLYASIRKQKALEGELAMIRRRRSLLMTSIVDPPVANPYLRAGLTSGLSLLPSRQVAHHPLAPPRHFGAFLPSHC